MCSPFTYVCCPSSPQPVSVSLQVHTDAITCRICIQTIHQSPLINTRPLPTMTTTTRTMRGTGTYSCRFAPPSTEKFPRVDGYPRLKVEWPPGGAVTLEDGLPVITFPEFWLCPLAKAFEESTPPTPPPLDGAYPGGRLLPPPRPPLAFPLLAPLLPLSRLRSPNFPPNPPKPCW